MDYAKFLFLFLFLSGCIPLTQTRIIPHEHRLIGSVESDGSFDVGWKYADTLEESKKPHFNEKASFVISPDGKKYHLKVVPSGRDVGISYWRSASIFLVDPDNPEKLKKWHNGEWKIHFEFMPPYEDMIFNNTVKVWTFFYNPIIHGPPN